MFIQGLQKMTLLDYPEHVACTVFLGWCDFRCPFCHNSELVTGPFGRKPGALNEGEPHLINGGSSDIDEAYFFDFLDKRKGLLDGVAITGGEPCLRNDLPEFIAKIKEKGFLVKLDTNGNHPEMLKLLMGQHLVDYVAMDIKNSPEKYAETSGLMGLDLDPIKESIDFLIGGEVDYEFRTTVMEGYHRAEDFHEIGKLIRGAKRYFIQPFVDREFVPDHSLTSPSMENLILFKNISAQYVELSEIRGIEASS